jgi:diadenosine tetraphosphate (Ap4A) HIT family hydrolase
MTAIWPSWTSARSPAATQSVFHIHLHVLPRRNGDKLSVAKGMLLRRDPDREATGQILRDALAEIDAGR